MGRAPCCEKDGLKKGPWTVEEDQKLIDYIQKNGHGSWRTLPKNAGLSRCGKSCRLRWTNYLRPDIKRGRFSFEEEETIIQLHSILGNKWSAIAARLPGRTDNEIKNYWNTHIRKRLLRMGIDPVTHAPRLDLLDLSSLLFNPNQIDISSLIALEPLVNSEIIRLATTFLSPSVEQPPFPVETQNMVPLNYETQTACTTSNAYGMNEAQMMEMQMQMMQSGGFLNTDVGYQNLDVFDYQKPDIFVDGTSNQNNNMMMASVVSTPGSSSMSHLNCSNGSTEDEKDSYCSTDLFSFQIPDLLDADFL